MSWFLKAYYHSQSIPRWGNKEFKLVQKEVSLFFLLSLNWTSLYFGCGFMLLGRKKNPVLPADRNVAPAALVRASKPGVLKAMLSLIVQPVRCRCCCVTHLSGCFLTHFQLTPDNIPSSCSPSALFALSKRNQFPPRCTRARHEQLTLSGTLLLRNKRKKNSTYFLYAIHATPKKQPVKKQNFLAHSILESYEESSLNTQKNEQ